MSESDDKLLSVNDVARLWGTGLAAVVDAVERGDLRSLDRGLLVAERRYDVPLIRWSWADALRQASPGGRVVTGPSSDDFHPALEPAFEFHKALDLADAARVYSLSSAESRSDRSEADLLDAWLAAASHLFDDNAGIGTTIYSLEPLPAVAARVIANAPAMPRAITKPTPATLVDALPLVSEADGWRVDLALFERRHEWIHALNSSPSGSEGSSGESASGTSGE